MEELRLQKWLALCGIGSRRACEDLIRENKIKVNGKVASIGQKISPTKDKITFLGKRVFAEKNEKYYIMLNKPRGYVTTMKDERGRKCVADLVKDFKTRLFPVGRLDKDSEGLLLMTNDGEFAKKIMHPSTHVSKTYRVTVKGKILDEHIISFNKGMVIDGKKMQGCSIRIISELSEKSVFEIVLYEGKNRQIRKMCEKLGLKVSRLKRIRIGQVSLGHLKVSCYRNLTQEEKNHLLKT